MLASILAIGFKCFYCILVSKISFAIQTDTNAKQCTGGRNPVIRVYCKAMSTETSDISQKQPRILLVDDDISLCELMSSYLSRSGFDVETCNDGEPSIEAARSNPPDLIVLDLMLPGMDGLTVCRHIRGFFDGPIVMFTALEEEIDEVAGLETGADDYIKKPVSPRLLLARIRALLRRRDERATPKSSRIVQVNELRVDHGRHEVSYRGRPVKLTTVEFDVLAVLASKAGEIVSREELFESLRHLEYDGLDRSVDLYVSRIRKKIGDDSRDPKVIKTVRGSGYLCMNE